MFDYNEAVDPSQPSCKITVINSNNQRVRIIDAIVDTGADNSCIPWILIHQLGLRYTQSKAEDFQGNRVDLKSSYVDILIQDDSFNIRRRHKKTKVFCISGNVAIIGRDILNQYENVVFNNHIRKWGMDCSCSSNGCILSPNTTPDVS